MSATRPKKLKTTTKADQQGGPVEGSHFKMHEQHQGWLADIANCQDDFVQWQAESRKMVAEIKQFAMTMEDHEKELTSHSEEVIAHLERLKKHEHALAEFEQGGTAERLVGLDVDHRKEQDKHGNCLARHAALKRRHRAVVAAWERLQNEVTLSRVPKHS